MTNMDNFEAAFATGRGGDHRVCHCGRIFWDSTGSGWESGELDDLRTNPRATAMDRTVGTIYFDNCEYVDACTCWHPRAREIYRFIDAHAIQIAKYLNLEKRRKQAIADAAPTVAPAIPENLLQRECLP
jgi:hypothetical protein